MIEQLRTERQAELSGHRDERHHRPWPEFVRKRAWLRLLCAPRDRGEVGRMTLAQQTDYRDWLHTCRDAHRTAAAEHIEPVSARPR
ncbi:hypothetical protein GS538_20335 [Rhodococcus hoagii]|nr:hypothetical protein [Prescottella equi]NKS71545.1 hypothetical protein [Prescottella equi]